MDLNEAPLIPIEVGNIFRCSWGYGQTNIDWYEVTAVSKSGRAKITRIASNHISSNDYVVKVAPAPGEFIGNETGYKKVSCYTMGGVQYASINVNSYSSAERVALDKAEALSVSAEQTAAGAGH